MAIAGRKVETDIFNKNEEYNVVMTFLVVVSKLYRKNLIHHDDSLMRDYVGLALLMELPTKLNQ